MYIVHVSFKLGFWGVFENISRSGIVGSCSGSIFNFFQKLPYCFSQWLHQSTFPQIVYMGSLFPTSSPTFVICVLFDDRNSDKYEVISHYDFHLHLPDN